MDVMILGLKDGSDLVDGCNEKLIQCLDGRLWKNNIYHKVHYTDFKQWVVN